MKIKKILLTFFDIYYKIYIVVKINMGVQLSWLERTPDKREVDGSSPFNPTKLNKTVER